MTAAEFATLLTKSKQTSSGWSALCPAHDDRNPSLSVTEGDDGRILVHCHTGCPPEQIVAALGLETADLFPASGTNGRRPDVVAEYDYVDERGDLLYQVVRRVPKDFRQRRPDGNGDWIWSVAGVRRVPYRLPLLRGKVAAEKLVFVVEGEKDADRLAELGIGATTNAGGAGKWTPDLSSHFRGAQVVVLPDNDGPGRRHAHHVAGQLYGVAAGVKVLELPGLPEKGDVSDWLRAGGTKEDLSRLVGACEPWTPKAAIALGASMDEWPERPRLPGPPDPEPLPLDTLPPSIRAHVESVAGATQTPPDLAAVLALACVSTAVGGRAVVEACPRRGWREPTNIYAVAILPPGTRKSAVYEHHTAPLAAWEREEQERLGPAYRRARDRADVAEAALKAAKVAAAKGKVSRDELEAARDELDAAEAAVPVLPRLNAPDATPEALVRLMAEQGGRLAILAPEGDPLRLADGRYSEGSARLGELKQAHCGESIRQDRIGRDPVHVERPVLTLMITMQLSVLETLKNKSSFRGEGVLGRILWVMPEHGLGRRLTGRDVPALDPAATDRYGRVLLDLLNSANCANGDPHLLALDPAALDLLYAFEAEVEPELHEGGRLGTVTDWAGKVVGQAVRLAALVELAGRAERGRDLWTDPVGAEAMEAGVRLARALTAHALAVLARMGADGKLADLRYVLRRAAQLCENPPKDGPTLRKLFEGVKGRSGLDTMEELEPLVHELEKRGCIRLRQPKRDGPGRPPSPRLEIHPDIPETLRTIRRNTGAHPAGGDSANTANAEAVPAELFDAEGAA